MPLTELLERLKTKKVTEVIFDNNINEADKDNPDLIFKCFKAILYNLNNRELTFRTSIKGLIQYFFGYKSFLSIKNDNGQNILQYLADDIDINEKHYAYSQYFDFVEELENFNGFIYRIIQDIIEVAQITDINHTDLLILDKSKKSFFDYMSESVFNDSDIKNFIILNKSNILSELPDYTGITDQIPRALEYTQRNIENEMGF